VHLANLPFSSLDGLDIDDWIEPGLAAVTPDSLGGEGYFPERALARWLAAQGLPSTVYAFPRTGVQPLLAERWCSGMTWTRSYWSTAAPTS
jgi:hypothetical protein